MRVLEERGNQCTFPKLATEDWPGENRIGTASAGGDLQVILLPLFRSDRKAHMLVLRLYPGGPVWLWLCVLNN